MLLTFPDGVFWKNEITHLGSVLVKGNNGNPLVWGILRLEGVKVPELWFWELVISVEWVLGKLS